MLSLFCSDRGNPLGIKSFSGHLHKILSGREMEEGSEAAVCLQGGILGGRGGLWESQGGARQIAQANSRTAAEMNHWEKGHPPAPGCSVAR